MRRPLFAVALLVAVVALAVVGDNARPNRSHAEVTGPAPVQIAQTPQTVQTPQAAQSTVPCPLQNCAYFDTMATDYGHDVTRRVSGLDPVVWGESRISQLTNIGGQQNLWWNSTLATCPGSPSVLPDANSAICNGVLTESGNVADPHTYELSSFYPRQPFDFAGHTGTVQFQTDLAAEGFHANWAQFAITDQPLPSPSNLNQGVATYPRNGVIVEWNLTCGGGAICCCPSGLPTTVGLITVVRNYVPQNYTIGWPAPSPGMTFLGSVQGRTTPAGTPGQLNTVQVQISATNIKVLASDPGSSTLTPLANLDLSGNKTDSSGTVVNPPLTFSRGVVWLQDGSYGPSLTPGITNDHEFQWANLAFDGPTLPRDLGYEVPDSLVPGASGGMQLGYAVGNPGRTFTLANVADPTSATAALVETNWFDVSGTVPTVSVNGNPPIATAWPFGSDRYLWRTIAVPVPLSQLHAGTNTITLTDSKESIVVSNTDLILVGAGGVHPVATSPPSPVPTPSPSPTAQPSPSPTAIPSPTPVPNVVTTSGDCDVTGYTAQATAALDGTRTGLDRAFATLTRAEMCVGARGG